MNYLIPFITLLCILLTRSPVFAEPLSLSISPPLVEITTQTDRSITKEYSIHNSGEKVSITPQLFEYSPEGISSQPLEPSDPWIRIVTEGIGWNEPFILQANEEQRILLSLRIPRNLEEKDYYRALVFKTNPAPTAQFSQSLLQERIVSVLLITVSSSGLTPTAIELSDIKIPKFIDSFGPAHMDMYAINTGTAFSRISGTITMNGPLGESTFALVPTLLLAGEKKHLIAQASPNTGHLETINIPGLYVGAYTFETAIHIGEGSINTYHNESFYAIPWKAVSVTALFFLYVRLKIKRQQDARERVKTKHHVQT